MWFGYLNQDHAHYYYPEYLDDSRGPEGRLELPGNSVTREVYSHDLLTDRALEFIRESADGPFFFYAAYALPHFSSKSEDPDGLAVPSVEPFAKKPWSEAAKKYAAMVTRLDADIGRIVDLVDELGIRDNTLIILTSDNGPLGTAINDELNNNGPLRGAKRDVYEGGIRVPFLVSWPGNVPKGKTSDKIVAFWDMMPTLAEIGGAQIPSGLDGISVVDAFMGKSVNNPHPYLYWDYGHTRSAYHQAVRMGDWKGVRLGLGKPIELYNLRIDISESNNVAAMHPEVVRKMSDVMKTAATPSDKYPVGELYRGSAIWQTSDHW
jgi:arylsulfatase A-like enzyme